MMKKRKDYTGKRFNFACRRCKKEREFEFMHFQRKKNAVLQCQSCGYQISRHIYLLDEQIKKGEKSLSLRNFKPRVITSRCVICGKEIKYRIQKQNSKYLKKCCSKECQRQWKVELNKKYRRKKREGEK